MIADGRCLPPEPGDIYIVNDPYLGGTHLMDVRFAMPVYRDGKIFCWLSNTGHWPDIGGSVPGGFSASATAVEQEGLRLPPVKLFKKGVLDPEIYAIICSNIRVADQRIGDIKAQAAALLVGQDRLDRTPRSLRRRNGRSRRSPNCAAAPPSRCAPTSRPFPTASIARKAFVDSDGVVNEPLTIALAVDEAGRHADLRFRRLVAALRRADEQRAGDDAIRRSTSPCATSFPDVPISAGAFEPLIVKRPEGTFLDAQYPRPVSGCAAEVSQRIAEAVFAAMVQALPDKVTAAPAGSSGNFALGGNDPARGRDYVMYQISGGGYGGNAGHDGLTNGCSTIGISKSPPVEIMEQALSGALPPLRPARGLGRRRQASRRLRPRLRGRTAARRGARVLRHGSRPLRPAGRAGRRRRRGQHGPGLRDGDAHVPPHLSKEQDIPLKAGDRVAVRTPGGGGYRRSARARSGARRAATSRWATTPPTRRGACSPRVLNERALSRTNLDSYQMAINSGPA